MEKRGTWRKCVGVSRSKSNSRQPPLPKRPTSHPVRQVGEETDSDDSLQLIQTLGEGQEGRQPPIQVHVEVDNCSVPMEVDTGASVSIMSEATYHKLWPRRGLSAANIRLQTYSKEPIAVVGSTDVQVSYEGQTAQLPLVVVKGAGHTLMGRNWLSRIRLNWSKIHHTSSPGLSELLNKYDEIFKEGLGTFRDYEAKLEVSPEATPRFCKARTLPYSMRQKVEEELTRLEEEGTLEPVDYSDWAAPIVAVVKSDQKTFTKLDLSQAYQQLKLDTESRKYVVINTHKGLFRYTRLPFSISSAPGIFQKDMESLLHGIAHFTVYIDILITGETESDHMQSLEEVLKCLVKAGLRVKKHKCKFMAPSVAYLGYVIDAEGLHPLPDKLQAVQQAPTPRSVTELKSCFGLLTYYGKFLPNLATHLAPLYKLLGKNVKLKWTSRQDKAFRESKELLTSSQLLVHFDPKLPLLLACDASAYGIGALLAHKMPDGSEKPIGYASRMLNSAERNYSQLEKKGASCVFGVKRFYSY